MTTSLILKCLLLAKGHVDIATTPISEYAMAEIIKDYNGTHFEATVIEGKMNSVLMRLEREQIETASYSARDYDQKSLTTKLDYKKIHSSIECEITEQ